MATFRGFKIKVIDEERLPSPESRLPRQIGPPYPGTNLAPADYPRHCVFIFLEPIRESDDDPLPNIDPEIRRIWKRNFNEGSKALVRNHQEEQQRQTPDVPDLPSIRLTYHDDSNCGEICITNTYIGEVEALISEPNQFDTFRNLKLLVEWVNKNTLGELERNIR